MKKIIIALVILALSSILGYSGAKGLYTLNKYDKVVLKVVDIHDYSDGIKLIKSIVAKSCCSEVTLEDEKGKEMSGVAYFSSKVEKGDKITSHYDKQNNIYYLGTDSDCLNFITMILVGIIGVFTSVLILIYS